MSTLADLVASLSPGARASLAEQLGALGTTAVGTTAVGSPSIGAVEAEPIAVIGIGCRLPGGVDSARSFWELLRAGSDGVVEVPADRWDVDAHFDPDPEAPGKIPSRWGGFLGDVSGFDADFFGISPVEAGAMDPQQRLMLEVAHEALAHAAIPTSSLRGTRTGVFAGMASSDYLLLGVQQCAPVVAHTSTGNPHSTAVGRLSYVLDARGPSLAVDTACSSSLVAVHLAAQSLRSGESDLALAGGVHLILSPLGSEALARWSMLSPDGRCKAFDASANGFVRGEGCGLVVLRRLADAQRDGNRVLAVILGSAVNSDGRSNGLTAPNVVAQRAVIAEALRVSAVPAGSIGLVETHGTGTSLGDPIEFDALCAQYAVGDGRCALGAVKTNLGHLEAAAGVTGLIKAVLSLHHAQVPPNLHFTRWNPAVEAAGTRFYVPTALSPWPVSGPPRRAAVSSFGFGGTNAHAVLEQAPAANSGHVWVFSGQGSQWPGMGRRLMAEEPAFAAAITELDADFRAEAGFSLADVLASDHEVTGIARIQPVVFGVQLALAQLWRARGHRPVAVIGHSMGEVAAAVVAGALTPADGLRVIARRSRLLATLSGTGAMAVVGLAWEAAEDAVRDRTGVDVAVHLSPKQTVLSGDPEQIARCVDELAEQGVFARPVAVDVASHSPSVDAVLDSLKAELTDLAPRTPAVRFYSTVAPGSPAFDADYWAQNLRQPVLFAEAVAAALADGHESFVEISPHPVLVDAVITCAAGRPVAVTASLLRPPVWRRRRYWLAAGPTEPPSQPGAVHPLLGVHVPLPDGRHCFRADLGIRATPWLADHRVGGATILPAAAYLEMTLAAGAYVLGAPADRLVVNGLQFAAVLPLDERTPVTTMVDPVTGRVSVTSRQGSAWVEHASAVVRVQSAGPSTAVSVPARLSGTTTSPEEMYARLRGLGQHHGPAFAVVTGVRSDGSTRAEVDLALPAAAGDPAGYHCHPVLLDAALQALIAACPPGPAGDATFLPAEIGNATLQGVMGRTGRAHVLLRRIDDDSWMADSVLTDAAGSVVAVLGDIYVRRVATAAVPAALGRRLFGVDWLPTERPAPAPASDCWRWVLAAADPSDVDCLDLALALRKAGDHVVCVRLGDAQQLHAAMAVSDEMPPPRGVVVLAGRPPSMGQTGGPDSSAAELAALRSCQVAAQLGEVSAVSPPRLWLISKGGTADPLGSALRALVRTLAYELPQIRASAITLDRTASDSLVAELRADGRDDEIAWRHGERSVARLVRVPAPTGEWRTAVWPGAAYVVTGGLGGLGLVTAGWLAAAGAGRVILNGRSAPSPLAERSIATMRDAGADVRVVAGDIGDDHTAARCVAAATDGGIELRGIVHAAAVLDDGTVGAVTEESCRRIWRPKAAGACRLDKACEGQPLDFFAVYSSAASVLGSPGQAGYAMANGWLDGFVATRRERGLPAIALNWGPWAEVGLAKDQQGRVLQSMTVLEGIDALAALLVADREHTVVAKLDPHSVLADFPQLSAAPMFAALAAEVDASPDDDWPGLSAVTAAAPADAVRLVQDRLRARVAAVLGHDPRRLDGSMSLTSLGIDSLLALRIRNAATEDFSVPLPLALLLQGVSIDELAAQICRELSIDVIPSQGPDTAPSVLGRARLRGDLRSERILEAQRRAART